MKKILLDCGSHFGKGLRRQIDLHNINESWKIYSWEANPYTYEKFVANERFKHLNVTAYNAAVSGSDGRIKFNIQSSTDRQGNLSKSGTGSSVITLDEWRPVGTKPFIEEVEVEKINLSRWISENLNTNDFVILKMDIEGAEYETLEQMIWDDNLKYINKMYIEWHSHMFTDPKKYKDREDKILQIFAEHNIIVENW